MRESRSTPPAGLFQRLGIVLCAAALAAGGAADAAVAPLDARSAGQLASDLRAPVKVSYSRATGAVSHLRIAPGSGADLSPVTGPLDDRARAFFSAQSSLFGIRDNHAELFLRKSTTDETGQTHLIYDQYFRGVPVFAGELRAHFDASSRLHSVNGNFVPGIALDPNPKITPSGAVDRAIEFVRERNGRADANGLSASTPQLVVYRLGLDKGVAGPSHLAWRVDVSNAGDIREFVFVDAHFGKVIDYLPGIQDAMNRRAFLGTDGNADNVPDAWPSSPDWLEGNPIPSGNQERDNMLLSSADVYTRFSNGFSRDSYDALGHVMDQAYTRNYGCPNASWNGNLISFCPGFTTHDVTAHEWGHAYTEYTHSLIYRWQSGALNEAYSDMWGEAFDLQTTLAGMVDTDTPNTVRTANSCAAVQLGLPRQLLVNAPAGIAGVYPSGQPSFGPNITGSSPTQNVVLVIDDGSVTADINDACETTPLVNAAALAGKIAFVNRGTCNVSEKTVHVQAAGAVGMILGNVASSANPTVPSSAACGTTPDCTGITIPTVTLNLANADILRGQLAAPINATFQPVPGTPIDNSIRWLMGEDVSGGALRDMWNPVCFANPGKVSDTAQYVCGTADNGGVHTNSGVPNHAFALLTDGGVYNGHTVTSIGLVKAVHLIYRAQTVYQGPASNFADHADAMEASCDDLATAATPLADPWGGSPQTMLAADCAEVADAMAAVEMRTEPTFCNFTPLLAQNPPAICTSSFAYTTDLFDWEGGAAGWTVSRRGVVNPGTFLSRDWTIDATLPGGRAGSAFGALDPVDGDCIVDDETGALVLESPTLVMPFGAVPRLTFDHYVASEATWDGGNVKISVNGGPYAVIPSSAFSFNAQPSALTTVGAGNTNPLAGEQAWHGTDGGSNSGTWGRTIGNLTGIVAPGQNFKLRYEFGNDGCGGTDLGWWVDDVRIYTCQSAEGLFLDGFEVGSGARWSSVAP